MKIGIIQGRLSRPIEGFQECPVNWQQEFSLLPELNLNHIEWIVTKKSFGTNPIFTDDVSRYSISSICADNLVDERIIDKKYLYNIWCGRELPFSTISSPPICNTRNTSSQIS